MTVAEHPESAFETELIERICWHGQPIAYIVRKDYRPTRTEFLTPDDFNQQVGFIVYQTVGPVWDTILRQPGR